MSYFFQKIVLYFKINLLKFWGVLFGVISVCFVFDCLCSCYKCVGVYKHVCVCVCECAHTKVNISVSMFIEARRHHLSSW